LALAVGESESRRTGLLGLTKASQWAVTIAATVLSTYALDAVATVAGLSLAAAGLLQGLGHMQVLLFLAATYLIWGLGLHVNLKANWALLLDTGTSTNALSKAAHDLMKLRTASLRARRFAAAVGYTGTELAKEAPYYAGAFGAVLFTDSVSSNDAIIFLGGANLGAAVYEYGLARLVRAFLKFAPRTEGIKHVTLEAVRDGERLR
jgi:hypothetical protein